MRSVFACSAVMPPGSVFAWAAALFALSAAALSAAALSAAAADAVSAPPGDVADVVAGGVGSAAKVRAPQPMHKAANNTFVGLISYPRDLLAEVLGTTSEKSMTLGMT